MGMDLGQILISLGGVFTLAVQLVLLLAGVFGLWVTGRGLIDIYVLSAGDNRFSNRQPSAGGAFVRIGLGGAFAVLPVLLWSAAGTLAGGGGETYALFSYGQGSSTAYCDQVRIAATYLFMLIGVVAWFRAGMIVHDNASGASQSRGGHPVIYVVGGTICFFITDVSGLISRTIGMHVGLDSVCTALQ